MTHPEPKPAERDVSGEATGRSAGAGDATWRYIGDRIAADNAYCARFDVAQAPEPSVALGGAWAYALPAIEPLR